MKQIYSAFILLAVVALSACRKDGNDIDIKTYDQQQIDAYIKANSLTGMKRDVSDGDTTGIYYEILAQGKGDAISDPTRVAFVYSIRSLDGKYSITDTITSRSYNYAGALSPKGLALAFKNIIKTKGTRARIIIPSRLAYGQSGSGTGSGRLPGNTSLEYYINVMDDYVDPATKLLTRQNAYDELSIRKYAAANGIDLSTYNHNTVSGLFWKQTQADTGKVVVTDNSTVYVQYTGSLLNGTQFDISSNADPAGVPLDVEGITPGFAEGIKKIKAGGKLSMLIPSNIAYGYAGSTSNGVVIIPPFSCIRFEVNLISVVNN
ncbi:FKBP-type peptidyl-prolyl cis-trans isomerase [Mucilaginibacter terrae]|uniref:Peptidyl-prolyl cis-trans isomerase n=1 Tax=Mucilaginibacter terrae TaxID=1955052 RepID=A0ABU3GSP2_9SPHI|nr:FKBP-type peptidyl-prolyl cis-trans isomerase [Mucilaginibacter terrae]MDT3402796.1 FKBP-type peptidyl-prolyl cis-trans isomerase FkpA [Mucilaginibacter terrae]